MLVIEEILDQAARRLGLPPEMVRERNFYRDGDTTHYGQPVKDAERIELIWQHAQRIERIRPAPRRDRSLERAPSALQARARHHAREVWDLLHRDIFQSRRARWC